MTIFWKISARPCLTNSMSLSEYADVGLSRYSRDVLTTSLQNVMPSAAQLRNTGADQVVAHLGRVKRSMNGSMLKNF